MTGSHLLSPPRPQGRVRAFSRPHGPGGLWLPTIPWQPNLVLNEWAAIVGPLLQTGQTPYRISGMYFEYANVAAPGDTVTPPSLTRGAAEGITYYTGLATSSGVDYLRIPLGGSLFSSDDPVNFPLGNLLTFSAQDGFRTVGQNGKPYGPTSNSVVYGVALVAMRSADDATQDLVFARSYFDPGKQQAKTASSEIGIAWALPLQ